MPHRLRLTLVLLTLAALSIVLLACGPQSRPAEEVRAKHAINDFADAVNDGDWRAACSGLTKPALAQLFRVPRIPRPALAQLLHEPTKCPKAFDALAVPIPDLPHLKAFKVTHRNYRRLVVKTDIGHFTLDSSYRIVHFPPIARWILTGLQPGSTTPTIRGANAQ